MILFPAFLLAVTLFVLFSPVEVLTSSIATQVIVSSDTGCSAFCNTECPVNGHSSTVKLMRAS